jgi:hypothetical protein
MKSAHLETNVGRIALRRARIISNERKISPIILLHRVTVTHIMSHVSID